MNVSEIYEQARSAGYQAADAMTPTPMVVGSAKSLFSNEIDYDQPVEIVNDGVCGFAWINIKPARGKFVNYLKSIKAGRTDSYYGGYTVWVGEFNQSMQRKEAYAHAFSRVLSANGITAYPMSRMD
tara:strand:- start:1216 stop:1593 length:378 start_codon:yes stop_codon:yes gene_type:complete